MRDKKGFTLLEMVIIVAIIAGLLLLFAPVMKKAGASMDAPDEKNAIIRVDALVKKLKYEPTIKEIKKNKMPDTVLATGGGNCAEIAGVAHDELLRDGVGSTIIAVYTDSDKTAHCICAFKETDGTWSMFQASERQVGYVESRSATLAQLIEKHFPGFSGIEKII